MSAFTPGPWESANCGSAVIVANSDTWKMIASVFGDDPSCKLDARLTANANLIAAAPELYEALESLEPYLDAIICYASTCDEYKPNQIVLNTQKALAKARGEA